MVNNFRQNKVLFFLYKALLFLAILIVLDFAFGSILNSLYFKQKSGLFYRATYAIDRTNEQIIVFGSSRANHHYQPSILQEYLGKSCYNAGRDGNSIFYHYSVLKTILRRYSPDIVILDFSTGEFRYTEDNYSRISSLLPYYQNHPEIRDIIYLKSKYERYKLASRIYPFNSMVFTILRRSLISSPVSQEDKDGYQLIKRTWNEPLEVIEKPAAYTIDTNKVRCYENFIRNAKTAGADVFIVCSPSFSELKYQDTSLQIGRSLAKKYGVPFFDYSSDQNFLTKPYLFADVSHLNDDGSRVFSELVASRIIAEDSLHSVSANSAR